MKPKPFSALNHLTVPCDMPLLQRGWIRARTVRRPGRFSTRLPQIPEEDARNIADCERAMTRTHKTTTTPRDNRPGARFIPRPRLLAEKPAPWCDEFLCLGRTPRPGRVGVDLGRTGQQRPGALPHRGEPVRPGEQRAVAEEHVVDQPDVRRERVRAGQAGERDGRVRHVEVERRAWLLRPPGTVDLAVRGRRGA